MNAKNLPNDWHVRGAVEPTSIYDEPAQPKDSSRIHLYGMREYEGHHLYDLPALVPVAEVVTYFGVGSHGAMNGGYDAEELVGKVALAAEQISNIIPSRPFFADGGGLKMKFLRPMSDDELIKISSLFPEENTFELGLGRYISEWDGESPLLTAIKREGLIHLWWD